MCQLSRFAHVENVTEASKADSDVKKKNSKQIRVHLTMCIGLRKYGHRQS